MARELSGRTYPNIGVPESHHGVSHHQLDSHNIEQYTKINTHQMSLFARFVEKLHNTPDGDGTLLDHSMIVYGGAIGDGNRHTHNNLPVVVAGNGNGVIRTGRHVRYPTNTPMANLFLSLLGIFGAPTERLGDSTGSLKGLS